MANDLHTLPQAERLLSGTLQEAINETATEFEVSNPPSDLPTYIEIDPDSSSLKELVRVTAVTGNNITVERGLNNGGTGFSHSSLATYKQNFTSLHYKNVVDAIESGYLSEDTSYTFTRVSTSSFKVVASGVDRTARYTAGRRLRLNGSVEVAVVSSSYSNPDTTVIVNATTVPATITSIEMEIGTEERFELVSELKATGAEINTGTEDAKIVTPKAIADSWLNNGYNSLYRQALINGNFDVWQRGTSFASQATVASGYAADRWHFYRTSGTGEATLSRQTASLNGSLYSCRVQRDNGSSTTQNTFLSYSMESGDSIKLRGYKLTLSFWAKCGANYSASSSIMVSNIISGTGTDQNVLSGFTNAATEGTANNTLTTSWQKFVITTTNVIADTKTQLGIQFYMTPTGTAGAADYFEIAQVQLCAGNVALPFMPKSYEEELRACQRFCIALTNYDQTAGPVAFGVAATTTIALVTLTLPNELRSTPVITATATDWQLSDAVNAPVDLSEIAMQGTASTRLTPQIRCTVASGLTANRPYYLVADGTANRLMIFSAEL